MSIYAPASAVQGTSFPVSGSLTFMEGSVEHGLGGRTIDLTYNGTSLGSVTTDGNGDYAKYVTITASGSFTLKAAFAGGTGLAASSATTGVQIGEIPSATLILVALAAYFLLRK